MENVLGSPLDRIDAPLKVRGAATYSYEHIVAGVTYGVLITSTIAKGKILQIDATAAERTPKVLLVMTHLNSPKLPTLLNQKNTSPTSRVVQVLQNNKVLYAGQPIGLVVAETLEAAGEAAQLVKVRYQQEPHHVELAGRESEGYSPAKAGGGGDPSNSQRGDLRKGMAEASTRLNHVYQTPIEVHNPMEPHAVIAVWDEAGHLTIFDATQGVSSDQERVASLLGMKAEDVRVISPYLGGGFGSKGPTWSHVLIAALAAKKVGRPLKLDVTRPQMFGMLGFRSRTQQTIATFATSDGHLSALRHDTVSLTSAFDEFVETASLTARMLYATPNNVTTHKIVRSDIGTPSFMRAPGEATGTYGLEAAMDELAYQLKMDPIELRLTNYAEADPENGKPWSSKSLRECYQQGAERFGWHRRQHEPRSVRQANTLVGYGMATAVYPTRRSPSKALARLNADGTFLVTAGTQDLGTGTYTIMTQVAAQTLGVPPNKVIFKLGDTRFPKTPVSGGSQTAASTGSAVYAAANALREKIAQMVISDQNSPLFNAPAADLDFGNSRVFLRNAPSKGVTFEELLKRAGKNNIEAMGDAAPGAEKESYSMYAFGAQFAEVHVDADLGQIKVAHMVGCFAAGRILNAKTARSQLVGGMIWGISMALYEDALMDLRLGRFVNNNLAEYHVPTNADVGVVEALWVDEQDAHINPIGAKGIGEIGITGSTAAIANAIFNATGVRVRDLPITPDKLLGSSWS
jgi:xanthine dehydrogenase YagR molybdenum-binding subunit